MASVIKIEDLDMNEALDREAMRLLIGGARDMSGLYGAAVMAGSAARPGRPYEQNRREWLRTLRSRK